MKKTYTTRSSFVLDMLKQKEVPNGKKMLDVGFIGGYAEASVHYQIVDAMGPSDSLVGIDIDEQKLHNFLATEKTKVRQQKHNLEYKPMSIFETTFADNELDVVFLLEVFEHLLSPYSVFDEIKRILKPGGSAIVSYPNPFSFDRMVRFMFRKKLLDEACLKQFKGAHDHKIFPHPLCLTNYLHEIGFEVQQIEFIKFKFKYLGPLNKLFAKLNCTKKFSSYVAMHITKK